MGEATAAQTPSDQSYFLTGWRIYRKVLDLNYMNHREVYDTLYQPALIRTLVPTRVGRWNGCAMAGR